MSLDVIKATKATKRATLLTGPSGVGKTHQFRTLHEKGLKGLYVDVEAKVSSLQDLDFDVFLIRNLDIPLNINEAKQMLSSGSSDFFKMTQYIKNEDHEYDFVYFDSLMRFSDKLHHYVKHIQGESGFDIWNNYGERMHMLFQQLVSLASPEWKKPVHVIATCGLQMGKDWKNVRTEQPVMMGNVAPPRLDYYFDDVIRLAKDSNADTGEVEYIAYLSGTREITAKVSAPSGIELPPKISSPNLYNLYKKLGVVN